MCSLVTSIFLYACELWSRAAKRKTSHGNEVLPQDITHLIKRPCYQRGSPSQNPAGNRTTRRPDHHKRRKLQWYGHVFHSSDLAKKGREGRQRKRWEDKIREWTGLEFGRSQRAVENRRKWRKLVAKSYVVRQRPSRLRD